MLTKTQIQEHEAKGFCVFRNFLAEEEVARLLQELEGACGGSTLANHDATRLEMEPNQRPEGTKVRRVYEPCTYYESFRELAEGARLVDSMVQLLGPHVLYSYSKINVKPGEIGSVVEWHQDMAYGPLTNRSYEAVLIYLDDADLENGCLQVVPGCRRMIDHSFNGYFQGRITETLDTSNKVAIEGKRGTAIFFNGLTPHAFSVNKSPRSRRTLILGYRSADAFPISVSPVSVKGDQFARVVHGKSSPVARFDMETALIPRYPSETKSLYEPQERSRNDLRLDSVAPESGSMPREPRSSG